MYPRPFRYCRHISRSALLLCALVALVVLASAAQDANSANSADNTAADSPTPTTAAVVPERTPSDPRAAVPLDSVSIGIVVDESSAMKSDTETLRDAVARLLKPMRDDDEVFLVAVKDNPQVVQDFTSDPDEIEGKLKHLRLKGKTPLYDSILVALNRMEDASNDRKAVVVFAAGHDDTSQASLQKLQETLSAGQTVPVYCIATKNSSWQSQDVLQQIAARSGGSALFPRRDKDMPGAFGELSNRLFGRDAIDRKSKPLANYDVLVVRSIPVVPGPATEQLDDGDNIVLEKLLVKHLRSKGLFTEVVDGTTPDGLDQGKSGSAKNGLELLGSVVEYKPATKRERRFIRMGGRSAVMKVQFLYRDAATGKIVKQSIKEGRVDTGVFGGSADKVENEALLRVVNQVVEDIARSR